MNMEQNNINNYQEIIINLKEYQKDLNYLKNYNNMTKKITKNKVIVIYFKLKNY